MSLGPLGDRARERLRGRRQPPCGARERGQTLSHCRRGGVVGIGVTISSGSSSRSRGRGPPRQVQLAAAGRAVRQRWGRGHCWARAGGRSCGHGLQVALQLADGAFVQGEEVEVEGGIGDIEVASLLNQVHDLRGQVGGRSGLGGGSPYPHLAPRTHLLQHVPLPQRHQPTVQLHQLIRVGLSGRGWGGVGNVRREAACPAPPPPPPAPL